VSTPPLFTIFPFLESSYLSVPLDVLVFAFVLVQTRIIASTHQGIKTPNVLGTITRDAEIYFAVISTSHFLIAVMFAVARVRFFTPVLEFNAC